MKREPETLGQVMNVNTFGNDVKKMIIMNVLGRVKKSVMFKQIWQVGMYAIWIIKRIFFGMEWLRG